ncbi:MAG: hypothetical protein EOO77_15520 [Oxalobacteraceae bacterium]|nr:MAG: hypothetical protein EOO77_15520 [Oxalobacteraceae bacterium]
MSRRKAAALTCILPILAIGTPADAQFGSLLNSMKSKAADKVSQQLDPDRYQRDARIASNPEHHSLIINQEYDFIPGTEPLVQTDFANAALGSIPATWKTNGSGDIVTVQGLPGKWLKLQNFASYKLANPPQLPSRFTVQFDIVVATDTTRDIGFIHAGFAKDNSVRTYLQDAYNDGAINAVTFGYAGDGGVASSATGYNHPVQIDMGGFANRVMHVSIAVDSDNERIYIDRTKIADAKLFDGNMSKYFFLSAPTSTEHNASVLFGNFRIDKFR